MPLYNWDECQKGDVKHVTRDGKSTDMDGVVWVSLYNQSLERFGITEHMEAYLGVKVLLTQLRCMWVQTGDDMILNQIAIEEINLKNLDPTKTAGMTTDQCLVHLSKWLGYHVRKRELTYVEFRNLMTEYERSNKEK
jgi:hypothetical protein